MLFFCKLKEQCNYDGGKAFIEKYPILQKYTWHNIKDTILISNRMFYIFIPGFTLQTETWTFLSSVSIFVKKNQKVLFQLWKYNSP